MSRRKNIVILGSTGSIGTQALEVIGAYPDKFDLQVITANKNGDLLITGTLSDTADFDPGIGVYNMDADYSGDQSTGSSDFT